MLLTLPAVAGTLQGPHEHGSLEVSVTRDNEFLIFKILMPSQDLLGFEGSPKSAAQKETVIKQYEKLYQEEAVPDLFSFFPASSCKPYSANMSSDMLDYHEHDDVEDDKPKDDKDVHSVGDKDGHSDFLLNYVFQCDKVELIQITFHKVFPGIKRVNYYGGGELKGDVVASVEAEDAVISGSSEE